MEESQISRTESFESTVEDLALTLAEVDTDGTLQETAADAFPESRAEFLRRSVAAAVVGRRRPLRG